MYRTDGIGAFLNYASYIPALVLVGLVFCGRGPAQTTEGVAAYLLISLLFIAPILTIAIMRSERVR